jgi:DNA invertase Pin-like site-specific DNA recombinase
MNPIFNQQGMNQQGMNQQGMNQQGMNQQGINQQGINQQGINQQVMNQQGMNQPFIINNQGQYIPVMMMPGNQQQIQQNPFIVMNQPQNLMPVPMVQQQQYQQPQMMNIGQNPFIMLQQQQQQPIINMQQQIPNINGNPNGNPNGGGIGVNDDNIIANFMGNIALNQQDKPAKPKKDISFNPSKNNSNVIKYIEPYNYNEAHFDAVNFPNEKYRTMTLNGEEQEYEAKDINKYTLETGQIMHKHNKSIPQDNMKGYASIYVRCSNPNGISIDTQMKACLKYAKNRDLILQGVYIDDGVSGRQGKNLKNGEIGFWKEHIENYSNLLIYSADRLTRHLFSGLLFLNTMQEKDIDVHFVNNEVIYNKRISAMNKSSIQQELQTAEKYSNDTSEKIKGTINRLKNEGKYLPGRVPYGYKRIKIDGKLTQVENPIEKENIITIKKQYNKIWNNFNDYSNDIPKKSPYYIIKYLKQWCANQHIKDRNQIYFTESRLKTIIYK